MNQPYQPPFKITAAILNAVAEISELLGRWSAGYGVISSQLRRENRIRTIQASLAIEHNSLSLEQVAAIMEGQAVLGLPRETGMPLPHTNGLQLGKRAILSIYWRLMNA